MFSEKAQLRLTYALGFGCFFQQSILIPVLPSFAAVHLGLSLTLVGIALAARSLVPGLIASTIGEFGARIGLRWSITFSALLMTVAGALYLMTEGFVVLLMAQVVSGTLYLGTWIGSQTYATRFPNRERVLGVFGTYTAIGQALGPLIGGLAFDLWGYNGAFTVYMVTCLLLAALGWSIKERPKATAATARSAPVEPPSGRPSSGNGDGLRPVPVPVPRSSRMLELIARPGIQTSFLFAFICMFIMYTRIGFVPIYMDGLGFSGSMIGLVMSAGALGNGALRPFTKELIRVLGMTGLLLSAAVIGVIGVMLMPLMGSAIVLALLAFSSGMGVGLQQSVGLVMVADHTSLSERGYAVGMRVSFNMMAQAIAPFVIGIVADLLGIQISFFVVGGALLLLTVYMGSMARKIQGPGRYAEQRAQV